MSTLTFHEGRPRVCAPELPPTLTPNPIQAMAKAPSRVLSGVGSLLVYGVFAVGSVALARNVHTNVTSKPPTTVGSFVLNEHDPVDRPTPPPPPPPERLTTVNTPVARPADWKPVDTSNTIPEVTPTTLPERDAKYDGYYTKDMPVAKDPNLVTPPNPTVDPRVIQASVARVVDVNYSQVRVLKSAPVTYPPIARLAKVQGPVELLITIDSHGIPSQVEVVSGPGQLQGEALRCAKEWRFEPARVDGQPVGARFRLTIHFKLM